MRRIVCLAAAVLLAAGCAGTTASTPAPAATPASSASGAPLGPSVANGLTVPVAVYINGSFVGTVPAGTTEDPVPAPHAAMPWSVEARSPGGRVLATLTLSATDYLSSTSGRIASADLACGRLVLWVGAPPTGGPSFVPDPSRPCDGAAIDEARAGQIARDSFATAHGTGVTLTDVRETDLGITNDTACGPSWEVKMEGTVTESTGTSYGSVMYLCVDPATGGVTRGPAG